MQSQLITKNQSLISIFIKQTYNILYIFLFIYVFRPYNAINILTPSSVNLCKIWFFNSFVETKNNFKGFLSDVLTTYMYIMTKNVPCYCLQSHNLQCYCRKTLTQYLAIIRHLNKAAMKAYNFL